MSDFFAILLMSCAYELLYVQKLCEQMVEMGQELEKGDKGDQKFLTRISSAIKEAQHIAVKLQLGNTLTVAEHALDAIAYTTEPPALSAHIGHVADALIEDLRSKVFIQVHETGFFQNRHVLGEGVVEAFPSAEEDIVEAGNCFAVGRDTAAVFHLMRAVEWGMRALCRHLKIKNIPKSNKPGNRKMVEVAYAQWKKMLTEIRKKVDEKLERLGPGPIKQGWQEFYVPLIQDLNGFRQAHRNHVMHSRQKYEHSEAKAIFDRVGRFLTLLSTKVHE